MLPNTLLLPHELGIHDVQTAAGGEKVEFKVQQCSVGGGRGQGVGGGGEILATAVREAMQPLLWRPLPRLLLLPAAAAAAA